MPAEDLSAALGTVAEHAHRLNHHHEGRVGALDHGAGDFSGYQFRTREGMVYRVGGRQTERVLHVAFPFDVVGVLDGEVDDVGEYADTPVADRVDADDHHERALKAYVETELGDALADLESELVGTLRSPHCEFSIRRSELDTPVGFRTTRRICPYDHEVTTDEYGDAVRKVVAVGKEAMELFSRRIGPFDEVPAGDRDRGFDGATRHYQ